MILIGSVVGCIAGIPGVDGYARELHGPFLGFQTADM